MYRIILSPQAEKFYKKLFYAHREIFSRIDLALKNLASNPFSGKPLKHRLKGKYSLRVGVYRIIYSVDRSQIVVYILDIGHRREVYR